VSLRNRVLVSLTLSGLYGVAIMAFVMDGTIGRALVATLLVVPMALFMPAIPRGEVSYVVEYRLDRAWVRLNPPYRNHDDAVADAEASHYETRIRTLEFLTYER